MVLPVLQVLMGNQANLDMTVRMVLQVLQELKERMALKVNLVNLVLMARMVDQEFQATMLSSHAATDPMFLLTPYLQ